MPAEGEEKGTGDDRGIGACARRGLWGVSGGYGDERG